MLKACQDDALFKKTTTVHTMMFGCARWLNSGRPDLLVSCVCFAVVTIQKKKGCLLQANRLAGSALLAREIGVTVPALVPLDRLLRDRHLASVSH